MERVKDMNYREFLAKLTDELRKELADGDTVAVRTVQKNNGIQMKALSVCHAEEKVCPMIYMAPFYRMYTSGKKMDDIVREVLQMCQIGTDCAADDSLFFCFEKAKSRLTFRLIHYESNYEFLSRVVYRRVLDFAIVYCLFFEGNSGQVGTSPVYREYLNVWGVAEEELYRTAMERTPRILPLRVQSLDEILGEALCVGQEDCACHVYAMTNRIGFYGAAAAFYPGAARAVARSLGSDLLLLPSSVHEFLVLPSGKRDRSEIRRLEHLVSSVNSTHLSPDEVLSGHVYRYRRNTDQISVEKT